MLPALALLLSLLIAAPPVEPVTPAAAQRPPAPRWRGVGLSIGAGVVGSIGLALNLARVGVVQRACADLGASGSEVKRAITDCVQDSRTYIGLSALAPLASVSALGLAAGAGVVNGRHRGWLAVHGGRRRASTWVYIGVGAGLLGAGVLAYAVAQIGMWRDLYGVRGCLTGADISIDCVRSRWSGWLAGITVGQAGAAVGAGLLGFGIAYRIRREGRRATLSVRPALSLSHAGIRLSGSF